jgi:hypothetical protein
VEEDMVEEEAETLIATSTIGDLVAVVVVEED